MRAQRESAIPRHPSNSRLITKMVDWGWKEGRTNGRWMTMHAPAPSDDICEVRPGHQHDANPTSVFLEVYRKTTDGDAELFWRGPSPAYKQKIARLEAIAHERQQNEQALALARAESRAMRARLDAETTAPRDKTWAVDTPAPEPPVPTITEEVKTMTTEPYVKPAIKQIDPDAPFSDAVLRAVSNPRSHGDTVTSSRHVLQAMVLNAGVPMTVAEVAYAMGLNGIYTGYPSALHDNISSRLVALYRKGAIKRTAVGLYVGTSRPAAAVRKNAKGPKTGPRKRYPSDLKRKEAKAPATTVVAPTPAVVVAAPPPKPAPVETDVDGIVEAMLDLLFPNGIKASQIKNVLVWQDCTRALIEAAMPNG